MSQAPHTIRSAPLRIIDAAQREADDRMSTLVARSLDLTARMIRNVGAPTSEIDDLVQQAFSITAARLEDIAPGKERAFLIQTAIRLAMNSRRARAQAREVAVTDIFQIADRGPSPEELADQSRAWEFLDRILDSMDVDLRSVFLLFEVEELTMAQISSLLDISPGTVASRLRRAREDFLSRRERLMRSKRRTGGET
jgi:RNA polymerase sigma-70 factor (ECF subfamily)